MEEPVLHFSHDLSNNPPTIDWPSRRRGRRRGRPKPIYEPGQNQPSSTDSDSSDTTLSQPLPASIYSHGRKSLSGVALRAFVLGSTLGLSSCLTAVLLFRHPCWRALFFLSTLSLFHFLEYYLTALCNTPAANINAFLLSQNGRAYNTAHAAAFSECLLTSFLLPSWQARWSNTYTVSAGLVLMVIGQSTRSAAMAKAGTNFNHTVQTRRNEGHTLVTTGIYAWCRHPSYFGFFWWGIGTQLVLGNCICFLAYTVILWSFFRSRTRKEEELLTNFFGKAYEDYRSQTRVWIPFIP